MNEIKHMPKVFIGSSSEGKKHAKAIVRIMEQDTEPVLWTDNVFTSGYSVLESLEKELKKFEFAVFLFSGDDIVISRGEETYSVRDNLLFELGLFTGYLGRKRTFFITERSKKIKMPSDLFGITHLEYNDQRSDGNYEAALQAPVSKIIEIINVVIKESFEVEKLNYNKDVGDFSSDGLRGYAYSKSEKNKVQEINKFLLEVTTVCDLHKNYNGMIYIDVDKMANLVKVHGDYIGDIVIQRIKEIIDDSCKEYIEDYYLKKVYTDSFVVLSTYEDVRLFVHLIIDNIKHYEWETICEDLYVTISCGIAQRRTKTVLIDDTEKTFYTEKIEHWIKRGIHGARLCKKRGGDQWQEVLGLPEWAKKYYISGFFS